MAEQNELETLRAENDAMRRELEFLRDLERHRRELADALQAWRRPHTEYVQVRKDKRGIIEKLEAQYRSGSWNRQPTLGL